MTPVDSRSGERGGATIIALLVMILLGVIGAALVVLTTTETMISASYRHAQEAAHGAEAALERALHDLAAIPDWSAVLAEPPANVLSSFVDGATRPRIPDGSTIDLAALTSARQRESDTRSGPSLFGADSPQWRLFAHAPLDDLFPSGGIVLPVYLVVWVADDGLDGDADPTRDANGRIVVHATAFGSGGARRSIESSIGRSAGEVIRQFGWHQVR